MVLMGSASGPSGRRLWGEGGMDRYVPCRRVSA